MELEKLEALAALEHRIDSATEKLKVNIKVGLMDTAQAIEEVNLKLQSLGAEAQNRQGGKN